MSEHFSFAILSESKTEEVQKMKSFIEGYGLSVEVMDCNLESLNSIVNKKITTIIVHNLNSRFSKDFIVEASIKKIFSTTNFYLMAADEIDALERMKWMTLGYQGFIKDPFSPYDFQNVVDLCQVFKQSA